MSIHALHKVPLRGALDVLRYAELVPPTRKALHREISDGIVQYTVVLDDGMMPVAQESTLAFGESWQIGDGKMVVTAVQKYPASVKARMEAFGMNVDLHMPVVMALKSGESHTFETAPGSRYENVKVTAKDATSRSNSYDKFIELSFEVPDDRDDYAHRFDKLFLAAGYSIFNL
jgi:hypothetical protein